jgi:capsular polysaccharide export protein
MLVFFAVRNHHFAYFERLRAGVDVPAMVVRHKRAWWPAIERLPPDARGRVAAIARLKLREIAQARPDYRLPGLAASLLLGLLLIASHYRVRCYLRLFRRIQPAWLALWSGVMWNQSLAIEAARLVGSRFIFLENGLLPDTTTADPAGVNFANSMPRHAAFYRALPAAAPVSHAALVPRSARAGKTSAAPVQLPARYVFVPFQVDVDRQVLLYSPWIAHMRQLYDVLCAVADALPPGMMFVVKEHPSSAKDYGALHALHPDRILFANANDTQQLIENAQAVITINSTVGIEALLFGKPVITLGQAFYNVDGLVDHADDAAALRRWVARCDQLSVNADLVRRFLGFLRDVYSVPGNWKTPDETHVHAMTARLRDIMAGEFQRRCSGGAS